MRQLSSISRFDQGRRRLAQHFRRIHVDRETSRSIDSFRSRVIFSGSQCLGPVGIKTVAGFQRGGLRSRCVSIFLATFRTELEAETAGEEAFKCAPSRKLCAPRSQTDRTPTEHRRQKIYSYNYR